MAGSSSVVIKVKYGDTLRRFSTQIVQGELNLNMDGLREKIISLFSFDPDTELVLTYIDEDEDVVTLASDDDLRDAVKQELDPLRITVNLNAEKNAPSTRLGASQTPLISPRVSQNTNTAGPETFGTSPRPLYETLLKISDGMASKTSSSNRVQQPVSNLNTGVSQVLKMIPEPVQEYIGKLSDDLAPIAKITANILSKRASPVPGTMSPAVDHFSKLVLFYMDQLSQSQPVVNSSTEAGIPESSTPAADTRLTDIRSELFSGNNDNLEKIKPEATAGNSEAKNRTAGGAMHESSENIVFQPANGSLPNLRRVYPESVINSHSPGRKELLARKMNMNKINGKFRSANRQAPVENNITGKSSGSSISSSNVPFVVNNSGTVKEVRNSTEPKLGPNPAAVGASVPANGDYVGGTMKSDGFWKNRDSICATNAGSLNFPCLKSGFSPAYDCPFSGLVTNGSTASPQCAHEGGLFSGSIHENASNMNIFHRGVRCDGCGVHPITGPRFKSKVKVDYDLCGICFDQIGNNRDYIRMDHPVVSQHHVRFKGPHALDREQILLRQLQQSSKVKPVAQKLDSRFIRDVNVFDGTVMAPLTPFTKIWRMRNNGTVVWPQNVQLVWIGGDKLNNELAADVQIPVAGLMTGEELEVAVDFVSPELPGRYISYWRMSLPSGQKFGQRVWVLIQVDTSLREEAPHENVRNLNLNLPPVSSSLAGAEIINVEPEPMVEYGMSGANKSIKVEQLVQPNTEQELKFPINDSLLVGDGASSSRRISYPVVDFSDIAPPVPSVPLSILHSQHPQTPPKSASPVASAGKSEDELSGNVDVEVMLLKELEEMGFKEVDLNKKMLRMNEYDLEQAVDGLCGVAEWDPILEELQEMGFRDSETNKRLLKKNNGSIKRVVMDLIAGEKFE
ncbi:hypothetical protein OROMI_007827 [Orobanche minor]